MYILDEREIALVQMEVEKAEISFSHLSNDLTDHICCDIESLMWDEKISFSEAFKRVKQRFGNRGLQKIQEDTLCLTDKSYLFMKTLMKITGIAAPLLMTISAYLKIMHWPFAGPLLILSFFMLCFLFLPSSIFIMYKENKAKQKMLVYVSGFIGAFTVCLSVLFIIMHWPGGDIMLIGSKLLFHFAFIPILFIHKIKTELGAGSKLMFVFGLVAAIIFGVGDFLSVMHWSGAKILILLGSILAVFVFIPWYSYNRFSKKAFVKGRFIFLVYLGALGIITIILLQLNPVRTNLNQLAVSTDKLRELNQSVQIRNNNLRTQIDVFKTEEALVSSQKEILQMTTTCYALLDSFRNVLLWQTKDESLAAIDDLEKFKYEWLKDKKNFSIPNAEPFIGSYSLAIHKPVYEMIRQCKTNNSEQKEIFIGNLLYDIQVGGGWAWKNNFYFSIMHFLNGIEQVRKDVLFVENQVLTIELAQTLKTEEK